MVTSTLFQRRYDENDLPRSLDPLLTAAHLVESSPSGTYVLYEQGGRWSLALGALAEITLNRSEMVLRTAAGLHHAIAWQEKPLNRVAELLDRLPVMGWRAYGWAGFELAYACAGLDLLSNDTLLHLIIPQVEVQLDAERTTVRSTDSTALHRICELLAVPVVPRIYESSPIDVTSIGCEDYHNAVAAVVQEIRNRRMQKVILSRVVPVEHPVDLVGSYVVGRQRNTPSRSFLLNVGGVRAAGFSPEIVVQIDENGQVRTQPLAGTRAMVDCAEENQRLRTDLLHDAKEIFEHAVSLKASWDELTGLCVPHSVVVDDFMTIKRRGTVQHLASSVSGQLAPGCGPWQAFATLFPAVTASGIPKKAAYECIRRHEPQMRGLYSGAVLTIDHRGVLDAALVLRTIFQQDGKTWLQAGAGIVEQSEPEREFEETCEKLRSVALHLVAQAL
ncbi:MAG: salicylate synthase [Actinomycetota bacterium]|nr:salicylate synthase [Actinomycetota bacterium]